MHPKVTKVEEFFCLTHCQLLELISQDSLQVLCESEVCSRTLSSGIYFNHILKQCYSSRLHVKDPHVNMYLATDPHLKIADLQAKCA